MAATAPFYPDIPEPEIGSGEASPVAPGLHWLRMPLGGRLASINIWALEDGGAWTVVDTGIRNPGTLHAWRSAETGVLDNRPVRRAIVTHMHPDHAGMAGWLTGRFRTELWMTRLEYLNLRILASDNGVAPEVAVAFYRSAGMDENWLDQYRVEFGAFGRQVYPLPVQFRAMRDKEIIMIGLNEWQVVTGGGHSPEHASLWAPDRKLFISGDQVLPTISSNVSLHPSEPDADPLAEWLAGLAHVRNTIPDDVLVLPAHGRPFTGLHARLDHLINSHEAALKRLLELLKTPCRAIDVFPALFRSEITDDMTRLLAVGEALAHLSCLVNRGLATLETDEDGIKWWRGAAMPMAPLGSRNVKPTPHQSRSRDSSRISPSSS